MLLCLLCLFSTNFFKGIMKTHKLSKLFCVVTLLFSTYSFAADNLSGIWVGEVNSNWSGPDANYKDDIYLSIHQTTNNVAIVILSAVEETKDLFSSTYLGKELNKLESYGTNAYFPDYNPIDKSLTYINVASPIRVNIHEGGQSGIVHILCDVCSVSSVIVIRKIL